MSGVAVRGGVGTLTQMRDRDVRAALKSQLVTEHERDREKALVLDELGLCSEVRVDVAVVNGLFAGFEIKSARDRLDRLPGQVATYSRVLDHATLVVAERHLKSARRELRPWWGIRVASVVDGTIEIEEERTPKQNPRIDPKALVQLLWKRESLDILADYGLDRGIRSKPREFAWDRLATSLPLDALRAHVRDTLKARREWRADRVRDEYGETLRREGTLSRFLARRLR